MKNIILLKGNYLNKNLIFFFIILLYINSCSVFEQTKNLLKENNSAKENTNLIFLNFKSAIENIVLEMSHNESIFFSKKISLYINMLNNESHIFLENKKLTNLIRIQIFKKINKFNIIHTNQINKTKKELGLSEDDNFINVNTAILLARNNQATYYLDSKIIINNKLLLLKVKLILVKTGEIIFQKTKNLYYIQNIY
ncbi:hypothetical protein D9V62_01815 [Buchnera aphidicola (Aphis helianthi)]|uniref:Penicillin-binding protein activator LpoB n=1 Tax=Buchnera aphidicola (Aphis helianthi) TaxID=2315802 RepID=A0A4D6XWX5_9GAMM|nr:hypothetical protein D9V62_01815 [Buchnera aphidicola (Aphis helianthi)]